MGRGAWHLKMLTPIERNLPLDYCLLMPTAPMIRGEFSALEILLTAPCCASDTAHAAGCLIPHMSMVTGEEEMEQLVMIQAGKLEGIVSSIFDHHTSRPSQRPPFGFRQASVLPKDPR